MRISDWSSDVCSSDLREPLASLTTNADGRCDSPVLEGTAFAPGTYELVFHVAAYFRGDGLALPEPPFLDAVPVRFGVAEGGQHVHVPLLISPYGYSTYRSEEHTSELQSLMRRSYAV